MSKVTDYAVLREHEGDRLYMPGETRQLTEVDARHLVKLGVLAAAGEKPEKAEPNVSNKAAKQSPNKAG